MQRSRLLATAAGLLLPPALAWGSDPPTAPDGRPWAEFRSEMLDLRSESPSDAMSQWTTAVRDTRWPDWSPDTDADGIPDWADLCATTWTLRDVYSMSPIEDGCPPANVVPGDYDLDGVHDQVDRCPSETETPKGRTDEDGCPDDALADLGVDLGPALPPERPVSALQALRLRLQLLRCTDTGAAESAWVSALAAMGIVPGRNDADYDGDGAGDRTDLCPDEPAPVVGDSYDVDGCGERAEPCARTPEALPVTAWDELRAEVLSIRDPELARQIWRGLVARVRTAKPGWTTVDTDGDGFADWRDLCVTEPEAFVDTPLAGCPAMYRMTGTTSREDAAQDADMDGTPDIHDSCAQPETVNGLLDDDGCPDTVLASLSLPRDLGASAWERVADVRALTTIPPDQVFPSAPAATATLRSIDEPLKTGVARLQDGAVVIGLEDYSHVPDVPFARRDAEAFRDWLVYTRGVPPDRVALLTEASREHMLVALEDIGGRVGPGGIVWVFFAGHGAADPTTTARLLLGDDVRGDATGIASRGLAVSEVEQAAARGGGTPLLIIDSCFAGAGRDGQAIASGLRFAVPAYATKSATGIQWNASRPNELSGPLEEAKHGAFTYWAVGALRGWADGELDGVRDGNVTGMEANTYVERMLRGLGVREQHPVWVGAADTILSTGTALETGPPAAP